MLLTELSRHSFAIPKVRCPTTTSHRFAAHAVPGTGRPATRQVGEVQEGRQLLYLPTSGGEGDREPTPTDDILRMARGGGVSYFTNYPRRRRLGSGATWALIASSISSMPSWISAAIEV